MTLNVRTLSRYALTLLAVPALPVLAATSYSFTGSTCSRHARQTCTSS